MVGHDFSTLAHWYKETRSLSWRVITMVVGHRVFPYRWNSFCWGWCSRVSWKEAFLRGWWIAVTLHPHKVHVGLSWRAAEGKMGLFWSRIWGHNSSWQGRKRNDWDLEVRINPACLHLGRSGSREKELLIYSWFFFSLFPFSLSFPPLHFYPAWYNRPWDSAAWILY